MKPINVPAYKAAILETEIIQAVGHKLKEELGEKLRIMMCQQRNAVTLARPALQRLVDVMGHRTGQGYKLRALLWSLWNGKPTSLSNVCGLDHQLRQDLCDVMLAWGYGRGDWEFFYDAMKAAVSHAGLWEWFLEEGGGQ